MTVHPPAERPPVARRAGGTHCRHRHGRHQPREVAEAERVLADARAAGCWKVQVVSHTRHTGAYAFYEALGLRGEATGFRLYLA